MKKIYLILFALSLSLISKSQCESLELIQWTSENDTTFTVEFFSQSEVSYELVLRTDYGELDYPFEPITISGEAAVGSNEVSVVFNDSPEGWPYPPYPVQPENVYFTTLLYYECAEGENSDTTKFYMSRHTLINTPGFNCDSLYTVFEPLPDGSGVPYETTFSIPDNGEIIESLSVFLDIGHTYNGDLSIMLTHPGGTTVTLHAGQALDLGGSQGFSVVFAESAQESVQNSNSTNGGPRGFFQPYNSFAPLIGLPVGGEWTLTIIDNFAVDDGMVFGICLDIDGTFCESSIQGKVFADYDGNGEFSANDYPYPFPGIANSIDDNVIYGNSNGSFLACSEEGSGNLSILNAPPNFTSSDLEITVGENEAVEGINMILVPEFDAIDLAVDLFSPDPNRPGFEATYILSLQNIGTICEQDGELTVSFPEFVEIIASDNSALDFSENEASLEMIELCPFETLEFEIEIILDDTVSLGTILEATAEITGSTTDANPSNNIFTSAVEVIGAYDPNDKQVSAETIGDDFLESESPLKYTIRFQNTGTFYAERVEIVDTIDTDLDINSLQIISTSHDMELSREGNVLTFEFDQIFLPDSATDFEGSIGYVRYEIDPLPSFSEGDLIENTAYIYFDFNEPIVTNTVVTEFGNPLSTGEADYFKTITFPNPVRDILTITWNNNFEVNQLEVYDLNGRKLIDLVVNSSTLNISTIQLPSGVYVIKLIGNEITSTAKFVKVD